RQGAVHWMDQQGYLLNLGQVAGESTFHARMVFMVVDGRCQHPPTAVDSYPLSYHDNVNSVHEIAGHIRNGEVIKYDLRKQRWLEMFAGNWLAELQTAEYF